VRSRHKNASSFSQGINSAMMGWLAWGGMGQAMHGPGGGSDSWGTGPGAARA